MQHFDGDYAEWVVERLGRAARKPAGAPVAEVLAHLRGSVERSMGRAAPEPFRGGWFSVRVRGPLVLAGVLPFPEEDGGTRGPGDGGVCGVDGEMAALKAVLEEYLALVQADELPAVAHPLYGPLDVAGWEKYHLRHFEHHLGKLGV